MPLPFLLLKYRQAHLCTVAATEQSTSKALDPVLIFYHPAFHVPCLYSLPAF